MSGQLYALDAVPPRNETAQPIHESECVGPSFSLNILKKRKILACAGNGNVFSHA